MCKYRGYGLEDRLDVDSFCSKLAAVRSGIICQVSWTRFECSRPRLTEAYATISFIVVTAPATAFGCLLLRPWMQASKTVSALPSHSTMRRESSMAAFFEPALAEPKMFLSMMAAVRGSLAAEAADFPPYWTKAHAHRMACSCATAFASLRAFASIAGS